MKENKNTMREFIESNLMSMGASEDEAKTIVDTYERETDKSMDVPMVSYAVHETMVIMLDIGRISAEFFKNKKETK